MDHHFQRIFIRFWAEASAPSELVVSVVRVRLRWNVAVVKHGPSQATHCYAHG